MINRTSGETVITQHGLDKFLHDNRTAKCVYWYKPDHWPCVDQEWIWYPKSEEATWRSNKAQELLKQAMSVQGNPVQKLDFIRACAQISGLDLEGLIFQLESNRASPKESLVDIFKRIKPA